MTEDAGDPRRAGYGGTYDGRLVPGERSALIVIDVCDAYLKPHSSLYGPAFVAALPIITELVAAARDAGRPVIFTRVLYQNGGIDGGLFYRKVPALKAFEESSPLRHFPAGLRPLASDVVVTKQYASAFFATSLAATLVSNRIDSVVLAGFSTSGCVRATALDALQNGIAPFVAMSACADRHAALHESNLFDLQSKYAEVVDTQAALDILGAPPPSV